MQTAQFFNQVNGTNDENYYDDFEQLDDQTLKQNDEIFEKQNEIKSNVKEQSQGQKIGLNNKQKKKNPPTCNLRDTSQPDKFLTQQDQSSFFSQNDEKNKDQMTINNAKKQNNLPQQSTIIQNQLLSIQQAQQKKGKIYNFSNERTKESQSNGLNIGSETKARGFSQAYGCDMNQENDKLFWNKINQIVCINSQSENKNILQTQNSFNNTSNQYSSITSSNRQTPLMSNHSHKNEVNLTVTNRNHSQRSEPCVQDIMSTAPSYSTIKSSNFKDIHLQPSHSKQSILSAYNSMKNFNDQLPLLNSASTQQKPDSLYLKKGIYSNKSEESQITSLNYFERNFWSSQLGMRQDLYNGQNIINKPLDGNQQRQLGNNRRVNIQHVFSASSQQRISSQDKETLLKTNPQSCKNLVQQKNQMLAKNMIKSPSESLLFSRVQAKSQKHQNEDLIKKSNNYINDASLQSNRDAQSSFFTKQQIEGIENYYYDSNNQQQKIGKNMIPSHNSETSYSSKDIIDLQNQQTVEYLTKEPKRVTKSKIQATEQMNNMQSQDQISRKFSENENKGKQIQIQNTQENIIKNNKEFLRKSDNSFKENLMTQPSLIEQSKENLIQNKLKRGGGIQLLRNSMQLSDLQLNDDLQNIISSQSVRSGLRESSLNGENRFNVNSNNQNLQIQKARIKSCQQSAQQNQEFSFCFDQKQFTTNEDQLNDIDCNNILGQTPTHNKNDNINYYNTSEKMKNLKLWTGFEQLSQTTKNNSKFNLKCKQQQNVVKKIFNFDAYQQPQLVTAESARNKKEQNASHSYKIYKNNLNANQIINQQSLQLKNR